MIWRKLLPALFFIASLQTLHAQIPKGTIMAGGNLGFQFSTDRANNGSMINFSFTPLLGGFVAKNFVLGISPLLKYGQQTGQIATSPSFYRSQFTIGAGPFVRYYLKIGEKAFIYFHAAPVTPAAEWDRFSKDKTQPIQRYAVINWQIGPGVSVMVAKGIALEIGAYYNGMWHQTNLYKNGNLLGNAGTAYVDHGMVLNVGFQVYFERNKKEQPTVK
ncbi:MAG: hypothetical protein JWO03_2597 [Bacteroidetes bacterium]|nr:hypothetical protein [Bacteroidota bacterium]